MRQVEISNATVEWLEAHLSKFGSLSTHVPRNLETARTLYLSESLDITFSTTAVEPDRGYLVLETSETLSGQTLRLLIQTVILCHGRPFGFDTLSPECDGAGRDGLSPRRWISIRFYPL